MTNGIHHITAIAGPAARNLDFYARVLGLRLVKRTVNFDDPGTYHLYYGDEAGGPGTILTFFPWANASPGRIGAGEVGETVFRVPVGALDYWRRRLGTDASPVERFGERVLPVEDPDGMRLALVGVPGAEQEPAWTGGGVPAEYAIRGFHGAAIRLDAAEPTAAILTDVFGFEEVAREGAVRRLRSKAVAGGTVDLHELGPDAPGTLGAGSVHHIAFRAADDAAQAAMVRKLRDNHGLRTTEQRDRAYFRSVYFREPGGVLFEIATDIPGFAVDEPAASLGRDLKLPRFLEAQRPRIEAALPALT